MQEVEDLCIKYLMNEMDPEERFSFESQLEKDPNLIIEVEIMRATLKKVKELPTLKAPDITVKKIKADVKRNSRNRKLHNVISSKYSIAAAATILVSSAFLLGKVASITPVKAKTPLTIQTQQKANKSTWIDKNNVISIDSYNIAKINTVDSLSLKNAKKLKLLKSPIIENSATDKLLLTRFSR